MKKRTIIYTALALVLSVGAGVAFAHGGHFYHKGYSDHGGYEQHNRHWGNAQKHARYYNQESSQTGTVAFEQHGEGHEQVADNATYHQREMKDPSHRQ
ncbi:MAG: hypothetical protein GX776_00625 [Oxalobacter sp.]|nr:hypothetical protein [Oxalobacter sp.]